MVIYDKVHYYEHAICFIKIETIRIGCSVSPGLGGV